MLQFFAHKDSDPFVNEKRPDGVDHRKGKVTSKMIVETTAKDFECAKLTPVLQPQESHFEGVLECNGRKYINDSAGSRSMAVPGLAVLVAAALLGVALF